jgi:hypothetical protein
MTWGAGEKEGKKISGGSKPLQRPNQGSKDGDTKTNSRRGLHMEKQMNVK